MRNSSVSVLYRPWTCSLKRNPFIPWPPCHRLCTAHQHIYLRHHPEQRLWWTEQPLQVSSAPGRFQGCSLLQAELLQAAGLALLLSQQITPAFPPLVPCHRLSPVSHTCTEVSMWQQCLRGLGTAWQLKALQLKPAYQSALHPSKLSMASLISWGEKQSKSSPSYSYISFNLSETAREEASFSCW